MKCLVVLICLFSLVEYFVDGISMPFRVPSFGLRSLGSRVQPPPARKSKLGAAIDKAIKLGGQAINEHVVPAVDKATPAVVKPYLSSADRYVKNEWAAAKKEWAECKKIYAAARNNYEKVDKVITIVQRNRYNIVKGGVSYFVWTQITGRIYEWLSPPKGDWIYEQELQKWGSRVTEPSG